MQVNPDPPAAPPSAVGRAGVRASVGREPTSGLYYEILGSRDRFPFPILFIHGGGSTGTSFRITPDGRAGWADHLAVRGFESWVTDWPGAGRSGYRDILTLEYRDIVDGYLALLRKVIAEPAVVVCHSMGGAITWKLVEEAPELVRGVVATASSYPANLSQRADVITDDGQIVHLVFADTGVRFIVDRTKPYTYGDDYIYKQAIAGSSQFPMQAVSALKTGLGAMSPRMLLQRVGAIPGMPAVNNPEGFRGKRIRLVTGGEDPAHTRQIEERTVDLLRSWGADASLIWLPDVGVHGNGHLLAGELNHLNVLDVIVEQLQEVALARHAPK